MERSEKPHKPTLKIVLATKNQCKIEEIREICRNLPVELLTLRDFPEIPPILEGKNSFKENALKKARTVAKYTGYHALADDSGIEVECLNGRPGVLSSRYAGENSTDEENNQKLLSELKNVPFKRRTARYVCVVAVVAPGGDEVFFRGECKGFIAEKPRGKGGFGYDPIFYLPEIGKTMAEIGSGEKNTISHRAQALKKFKRWVREFMSEQ